MSKKEKKEEQRSSGLKFITYSKENNALGDRPEGVSTKGNYWKWASVKQVLKNLGPSNKTNKTKTGVQAELLNNLGLSNKHKPKQAKYLGDRCLGVRLSTLCFSLIQISQMVLSLFWDSPRFFDTSGWTPLMFSCCCLKKSP